MKKTGKLFVLILALCLTLLSFSSCGAKESNEELISIAKELTEASVSVNQMIFGSGIAAKESGYSVGSYTEADEESLALFGVASVADIEARVRGVYSAATSAWIKNTVLTSVKEESQVLTYARYYDGERMEGMDFVPVLMVRDNHEPLAVGDVSYANYTLISAERREAVFTVDITVTDGEKTKSFPSSRITMVKEDGAWRLDTTTYATLG